MNWCRSFAMITFSKSGELDICFIWVSVLAVAGSRPPHRREEDYFSDERTIHHSMYTDRYEC